VLQNVGFIVADYPSFNFSYLSNYPGLPNASIDWQAPRPIKFQQWYPRYEVACQFVSGITCNVTLQAYLGSEDARSEVGPVGAYCRAHVDCMMSSVSEYVKADMGAATVVLGLTPSLLAGLGPTAAEVSLLSLRRPVLAFLLSLGSPAIYPSRLVTYDNPFGACKPSTGALVVPKIKMPYAGIISAGQYIFAAGAVANVLLVSYQLGTRAVLSWACEYSFFPILWSGFTVVIHSTAFWALRISLSSHKRPPTAPSHDLSSRLMMFFQQEYQLSANGDDHNGFEGVLLGPWGIALNFMTAWFGFVHVIFGTAVFSGQLFIETGDAVFLLCRYLLSALVCRIILYFETGGMRRVEPGRTHKWIVQSE
jgi:hypothetical protein